MYDIHVGDRFKNDNDTYVTVVLIDADGRIKYEFDGSSAKRWADRDKFLEKFPIAAD